MSRFLLIAILALLLPLGSLAAEIEPDLWDRPRSAQTVMASPVVRHAVVALQQDAAARIMIVHGRRAEAQAHAEELRAWLVALAVEANRVQLRADVSAKAVSLEVVK